MPVLSQESGGEAHAPGQSTGREHSGEMVLGRAGWLSPSGEERRVREEWGPSISFYLREDFEFAERVLWQEILNWVIWMAQDALRAREDNLSGLSTLTVYSNGD